MAHYMNHREEKTARAEAEEALAKLRNPDKWKVSIFGGGSQHRNCYGWVLRCGNLKIEVGEEYRGYCAVFEIPGMEFPPWTEDEDPQAAVDVVVGSARRYSTEIQGIVETVEGV